MNNRKPRKKMLMRLTYSTMRIRFGTAEETIAINSVFILLFSPKSMHQDESPLISIIKVRDGKSQAGTVKPEKERQ